MVCVCVCERETKLYTFCTPYSVCSTSVLKNQWHANARAIEFAHDVMIWLRAAFPYLILHAPRPLCFGHAGCLVFPQTCHSLPVTPQMFFIGPTTI